MPPVDMNRAYDSEAYARECYISYYYKGNPKGITASQMGQIEGRWSSRINSWKNYKENDENDYHISEDDWNQGHEDAKNSLGYDRRSRVYWQGARTIISGAASLGGAVVSGMAKGAAKGMTTAAKAAMQGASEAAGQAAADAIAKNLGEKGAKKAAKDATKQAGKDAANKVGGKGLIAVACSLDAAQALWYRVNKPNEAEKKASDEAAETMPELQDTAAENDSTMDCVNDELQDITDIATETTEEANDEMADKKTEYEMNRDTIEYFKKAQVQGYTLTAEDYEAYNESVKYMTEQSEEITAISDDTMENVQELRDDMDDYESDFDDVRDNIDANVTYCDYVAGFDESTYTQTTIQAAVQGLNAGMSGLDAASAFSMGSVPGGWWLLPFAGLAAAAAISDGLAAKEQYDWAKSIDEQIDAREATEDMNDANIEKYDEDIDYYEGYKGDVDDLNLEVPDDIEPPEEPEQPEAPTGPRSSGNDDPLSTGNGKGKKVRQKP